MDSTWEVLRNAGVPEGPPRPRPRPPLDPAALSLALSEVAAALDEEPEARRAPLHAWLCAFRHHWPSAFEALLGPVGTEVIDRLERTPFDANRHLKLRRIAIENLAGLV